MVKHRNVPPSVVPVDSSQWCTDVKVTRAGVKSPRVNQNKALVAPNAKESAVTDRALINRNVISADQADRLHLSTIKRVFCLRHTVNRVFKV